MTERDDLLQRLERYYDTVPRATADPEEVGPFTSFRPGPATTWPFYARPRLGYDGPFTADDVRRVLERRAGQGLQRNLEWVDEVTPGLRAAVLEAVGDRARRYPLLVRGRHPIPSAQSSATVLTPDHPDLAASVAAVHASFGETDDVGPVELSAQPELIASGDLIMVAVYDDDGIVVGGGTASPRGDVAELMGIGVLPRARGRGLGTAATEALTRAAMQAGVGTLFLSAGSNRAASIYRRAGYEDIATACILELDD